ncbi:MAG: sugar phosphate isomerase/epimerase family protein [Trueperaceae bacterium]
MQIADNLPLEHLSVDEQKALYKKAESLNVTLEVGTRGILDDNLKRYLEIAKRLHSRLVRVVVDSKNHEPSLEETVRLLAAELPRFENENIILGIENRDRFSVKTLAHIVKTLASSHIGIVFDTVNSFSSLEPSELVVETLGPYTVNLHMKDFDIRRADHNMGFTIFGAPAGQGKLDIPKLTKQLESYGKCNMGILELWTIPEADIEVIIAKEKRWAKESVSYLKSQFSKR